MAVLNKSYYLGFRTEKQREDYIEKHIRYSKKTSDENVILGKIRKIMEKTQKNESLRHLAESPMMLMFICLFHSKLKKVRYFYILNIRRTFLYN